MRYTQPSPPHPHPSPPGRHTPAQSGTHVRDPTTQNRTGEEEDKGVGGGGRKGKEGKGGMHNYAYIRTSAVEFFDDS